MDLSLQSKRAVVCGATQGIGKAIALQLASLGASVTIIARDRDSILSVMEELPSEEGQHHHYLVADFNMPDDLKINVDVYSQSNDVHILVNNTGGPPPGPALEARVFEYVNAFQAHVICNQYLVQAFVPSMKKAGFGRIINIISTSVKAPIKGLGVSNTIRGAVANWAKTLSVELGPFGITVNNILPGSIMTGRLESVIKHNAKKSGRSPEEERNAMINEIPVRRIGKTEEIAYVAAFLSSSLAGYINGINVPVDGGKTHSL